VDVVILGCTHYPFVSQVVENVVGKDVTIINPARETAIDAQRILQQQDALSSKKQGTVRLCFSADVQQAKKMAGFMLDTKQVEFELVNLST